MTTIVGQIAYDVTIDTSKMVAATRAVSSELDKTAEKFDKVDGASSATGQQLDKTAAKAGRAAESFGRIEAALGRMSQEAAANNAQLARNGQVLDILAAATARVEAAALKGSNGIASMDATLGKMARDSQAAVAQLERLNTQFAASQSGARKVSDDAERTGQSMTALGGGFTRVFQAVLAYVSVQKLIQAAEMADDMRLLAARVNVASDSIQAGADAMDRLREISTATRSALADNVTVFTRLNPAIKQMGGQASDTLRIVELLSKAITVSGASAAEKSSAMIQFGQALGSGKLAGDELRSLLENAPYLMKQLAAGLGVPIGALKGLGEQGKLTADVVVNALSKAADSINRDFAQFPQTLSSAFVVAGDALRRLNEKIDGFSQKSATLTGIVNGVTKALTALAMLFDEARVSAGKLGQDKAVETWGNKTAQVLSYVADAADVTWQTLSVLGRNVRFVFESVGREIGGIGAQIAALLRGDIKGAGAIGDAMKADAAKARQALDAADAATLADRKLWGQQMREQWRMAAVEDRGFTPQAPGSKLKPPVDAEQARKDAAKRAAAKAYLDGLLADTQTGLAKIALEEQKALDDNKKRALEDQKNADIYAKAKTAIVAKYARERSLLEEQYTREAAAVAIALTQDEQDRIIAIREEAFRAADADVRNGVKTFQQGEQAKVLAAYQAGQALQDLAERQAVARFSGQVAAARDTEKLIRLEYDETLRQAALNLQRRKITQDEYDAQVIAATRKREDAVRAVEAGRAQVRVETLQLKANAGGVEDQVALVRAQAEQQLQATRESYMRDETDLQAHAEKMVAIREDMERRIATLRADANASALAGTAAAFGALADATRKGTGQQDAIYRVAFAAQKAFSIASAIVAIQKGVAEAYSLPFPANIAAAATVVAQTASIIATIRGTNYGGGRQYGGPVAEGTMYRVNETGRPEMFTAANGAQYMLPTRDGKVTSADEVRQQQAGQTRVYNITQHFVIQPGTPQQTQQQLAAMSLRGLRAADARGTS